MTELPISGRDIYAISSLDVTRSGRVRRGLPRAEPSGKSPVEPPGRPPAGPAGRSPAGRSPFVLDDLGGAPLEVVASELGEWREHDYLLRLSEAARLQFPVGAIAVTGQEMVIVHEASRSTTRDEGGQRVRYGVALRLVIEVSQVDVKGSVSLPVVAAHAEIGSLKANASLEVRGYTADKVAKLLTGGPARFDVEGYMHLKDRVAKLQALVMGDSSGIHPVRLSVERSSDDVSYDSARAIGRAWGIARISDGKSADNARREAPRMVTAAFLEGVQLAYDDLAPGLSAVQPPSDQARRRAEALVDGLSLKRRRL